MTGHVLDDLLERFAATGPEFNAGLSNHGPMGAEALIRLGRADAALTWAEWYAERLTEHPAARHRIAQDEWREALGDVGRAGDWIAFFDRTVREEPWQQALDRWVARLGAGLMAGATHGMLRTAHAVRTLSNGVTDARLHELAEGLGYWAARYQTLPGEAGPSGLMTVADAVASMPLSDAAHRPRGLIFEAVKRLDAGEFAPVINRVEIDGEAEFIGSITRTFARQYLANASHAPIAFVHGVTAPSALRILAPHLSRATLEAAMRYAWQACAAIYATYSTVAPGDVPQVPDEVEFDRDDLIDRAVAARDEHAIKFTEACLREHGVSGDGAFIVAARDVVGRMRS
jgi:hypothetical protein